MFFTNIFLYTVYVSPDNVSDNMHMCYVFLGGGFVSKFKKKIFFIKIKNLFSKKKNPSDMLHICLYYNTSLVTSIWNVINAKYLLTNRN